MHAVFAELDPASYRPHALHDPERMWPETNCYADLWIEVVSTLGLPPEAMFGFTLTQDFEGDQMTFFKVPLEDLERLYGIRCTELAIFDRLETHVAEQIRRGRLCLVEMDSYYMPDTHATGYRREHGKTTVGINRFDVKNRVMDYFHNGGFYRVQGEDFRGLFQLDRSDGEPPFLPYTEFAHLPRAKPSEAEIRGVAEGLLARHFARRPNANPIRAFAREFPVQAEALADRPFDFFHKYAFNTLRQFGANFELAASHLLWLDDHRFRGCANHALRMSELAKSVQFQLARALTRRRFDPLAQALDPAADAWDLMMEEVGTRIAS